MNELPLLEEYKFLTLYAAAAWSTPTVYICYSRHLCRYPSYKESRQLPQSDRSVDLARHFLIKVSRDKSLLHCAPH